MAVVASQPPVNYLAGVSQAAPFQPFHLSGVGIPAFYHTFTEDFDDNDVYTTGQRYTLTTTPGTGTLAGTNGDGGLALFTTSGASGDAVGIQQVNGSWTNTAVKKLFFVTKLQMATVATSSMIAGLISTNATPFTAVADGIWFRWTGGGALTINSAIGSTVTSATIPAAAYTMANATNIELAFEVTRQGDILAYVDTQLVGYIPQSTLGTSTNPQNSGPVSRITAPSITTAILKPTLFLQTNSAATKTMTVDFMVTAKER